MLISVLKTFEYIEVLGGYACFVCFQGCLTEAQYEPTAVLLLEALWINPGSPVLVKSACLALASVLRLSGNIQQFFFSDLLVT